MTASAAALKRRAAVAIRLHCAVPERLTVTEWADRYRILPETSTAPGRYDSSVVPYARRWQDLLADPEQTCVVMCWASQTTKSTVLEHGLGYRIHKAPTPIIVLRPKIDDAEAWAKERLVPMILSTPVLRERVRLGRSTDSTLRYKRFAGGFLFVASAQSATEVASRSAPFVLVDECDRMEVIPGEGNPVEIVRRRMGAADVGLLAITSTPRDEETTVIWPYLEAGTYELYEVPCPTCDAMQALEWKHLKWPARRPQLAEYQCQHCAAMIAPARKRDMLQAGSWIATNPDGLYPSSHLNALYSPFGGSDWPVIAGEWERAQGKPADLQVFVNTRLAELWKTEQERIAVTTLTERLEQGFERGRVPDGAAVLTLGVDVQDNRIECMVWAWGVGYESWPVEHAVFYGDPGQDPSVGGSVWQEVREFTRRKFPHVNGREIGISGGLIDSGYQTTQVYKFAKTLRRRRIYAVAGVGPGKTLLGKPTLQTRHRYVLFPLSSDTAKNEFLRSQLLEREVGPGFVHLPEWYQYDAEQGWDRCAQLVAEVRKRHITRGRVTYVWEKRRHDEPNEQLDLRLYARGALELPGMPRLAVFGARAKALATPPELATEQPVDDEPAPEAPVAAAVRRKAQAARPRGSWAGRWRQ